MSTFDSVFYGESQSISKPPCFNGENYSYWKIRIMLFIQANDLTVWDNIINSPSNPQKQGEILVP
ncbi:Retrovirus-related Pol polyprotein from transposon TNT 1-94 [Gossypium australe]|uniref:Retrovirus-related Pol polyprotein from transposon TNT 1-94 n=1 Tax=Gossypium australe TaxID=47621 RepID=A0A5B6VWQ5_9ROSI|nr:Retrovirus-related Pol polyprotein from transposon TNT 1-94 [Gossypium australe]